MKDAIERRILGTVLVISCDLSILIGQIFGFDVRLCAVIMAILSIIPAELCTHYLNKRIEAQESEELKDRIGGISFIALIVATIVLVIAGAFAGVGMDLLVLIGRVTSVDLLIDYPYISIIVLIVIGLISTEICRHCLNKRIKAQESEELARDLEYDIARIAYTIAIVAVIAVLVLAWLDKLWTFL